LEPDWRDLHLSAGRHSLTGQLGGSAARQLGSLASQQKQKPPSWARGAPKGKRRLATQAHWIALELGGKSRKEPERESR